MYAYNIGMETADLAQMKRKNGKGIWVEVGH